MAKMICGRHAEAIEFDDRTMAHLQAVIIAKLRRDEGFAFTWTNPAAHSNGPTTIWFHPGMQFRFVYSGSKQPVVNRLWLEDLMGSANSSSGLQVVPEPTGPLIP